MPCPEDWLASTTQAFNGTCEIEGEGLGRLEDGRLVKDAVGGLPILVKLLDSDERLVIQAHPTVSCAKRLFNSPVGKTECWYFLPGTAPDACVYLGFKPGVTREKWERAVWKNVELWKYENVDGTTRSTCSTRLKNPLLEMLHRVPVAPGDFVFVDGGVPHAIGAGCFMVELQEPSDLMVVAERFTPSGRRIPDAKMHGGVGWEKMFDVYEYEGRTFEETCAKYVRKPSASAGAVQICGPEFTDKFSMWRMEGRSRLDLPRAACVIATDGSGALNGLAVDKGDRLLVADESVLETEGDVTLVVCA
jgi:mannose-6-phosphate isomerase